jgi:uncharacterized protein (DUF1810 family)
MDADPFDLQRFVDAQDPVWDDVLAELHAARKRTHWMWFIFPQLAALGRSSMARHYGLSGLDEARAYWEHAALGPRLRTCCQALLQNGATDPHAVFGSPDDLKLKSCMALFAAAVPDEPLFRQVLDRYYGGVRDERTLALVRGR